jgi:hypothetical protein
MGRHGLDASDAIDISTRALERCHGDAVRGHRDVGGADFEEAPVYGDTWEWDGAQWTERKVTGPGARLGAVMAGE